MAIWQSTSNRWLAAVGIAVVSTQAALAVPVLNLVATPQPVVVGSTVSVAVSITDIADLYAWQFSLSFDPALLQASTGTEGPFLASAGGTFFDGGTVDNSAGTVSFAFDTLIGPVPGANGSGVIANFVFNASNAGTSALSFSNVLFIDSQLATINVQPVNGSVVVSVVPEPASALLMGLGLGVAGFAAWRRRCA